MSAAGVIAVNSLFFEPVAVKPGMVVLTQGTGSVSCLTIQVAFLPFYFFECYHLNLPQHSSDQASSSPPPSARQSYRPLPKTRSSRSPKSLAQHMSSTIEPMKTGQRKCCALTDGKGVDHVVEVGCMGTIEQSIRSTKQRGLISLVGFLASSEATHIVPSLIYGGKTGRSP